MTSVSRPLIGLLVATVAFFAVWTLALKPKSSSGGGTTTTTYQSAIDKAHNAVKTSDAASAAHGGTIVTSPTRSATTPAATTATTPAATAPTGTTAPAAHAAKPKTATAPAAAKAHPVQTAARRQAIIAHALRQHKVVAMLLFNPKAADDRMVRRELSTVPTHNGRVVKLAVPVGELTRYPIITAQVPVTGTPTLVVVDRAQHASTIFGFSARFEIVHRIDQALAVQPG